METRNTQLGTRNSYVLITPARNEEAFIEKTIQSVISQTILPKKWVIVSDGSTDKTDEIVKKYLADNPWMELIRMPEHRDRTFAAKVTCFNAGYEKVNDLQYDIIGNLDADISFDKDYLEFLLNKFAENSKLGVAGTPFVEDSVHYDYRFTNVEHVSGACQLFRRKCFEEIGGYIPIKGGGIDWTAVTTARMKGWETRTFTEKTCFHHKKMGTGNAFNALTVNFRHGKKDYYLGGHPAWQLFRSIYQMTRKPYIIGGLLLFIGYVWALITRMERPVSRELMQFHRTEQIQRLKNTFLKFFKLKSFNCIL
ncbi:MAG: glycosyltransferase family 2 protein [Nitrospirae bacterium]|nr:glycosyltransferase family 2 protein [Nitrospirota bacterium]